MKVIREILEEDACNDTYGRKRMWEALCLKAPEDVRVPSERTVYRIMQKQKLVHRLKRGPKGLTKVDKNAQKSDNLLKRDFSSDKPLEKCVTDITNCKAKMGNYTFRFCSTALI